VLLKGGIKMKKDKCPNCKKKKLEKIPSAFNITDNREWWGCLNCGLTFFKKPLTND
jgi:ribosomal protein S27AE